MAFELPALPFSRDALDPYMSSKTLDYHYGKHHAGYVKKLNKAVEEEGLAGKTLLELVRTAGGSTFNNAAQVWNHSFFWQCLSPAAESGKPSSELSDKLSAEFGSMDDFKQQFTDAAASNFGSGWTWLVLNPMGQLEIVNTPDAVTPAADAAQTPLMTLDVWEHAYYLDRQNDRGAYIDAFWSIVNWAFVSENFATAGDVAEAA